MKFKLVVAFLVLATSVSGVFAQQKSERKSISCVNSLWLATPEARNLSSEQIKVLTNELKYYIEMERFDFNQLPEAITAEFVKSANAKDTLSVKEIAKLMNEKLSPAIVSILENVVDSRAGELITESQKQTFLATKAKELGITLEQITLVMNSAYIYLPVITGYSRSVSKSGSISYSLKGGIIWFHVDMSSGKPVVVQKVAKKTSASDSDKDDAEAFAATSEALAHNLQIATRSIDEFKLTAPITEVDGGDIHFQLGLKEGIALDDPYWVGEWMVNDSGGVKFQKNGWVRVGGIADNTENNREASAGWAVKKGIWAPGMSVMEHPRYNVDIAFKPRLMQMKISEGYVPVAGGYLHTKEDFSGFVPGIDIDLQVYLASLIGIRQSFFILGGSFAFPTSEFEQIGAELNDLNTSPPFVWGAHGGFMKKIYKGPLAISLEAKVGMMFYSVSQSWTTYGGEEETFTISNNTFGGQLGAGIDYAFTPDINVGAGLGFRMYPVSDVWTYSYGEDGESGTLVNTGFPFPEVNHTGLTVGLYAHYTPMALPFDPVRQVRKLLKIQRK